jgi:cytidylate kinase
MTKLLTIEREYGSGAPAIAQKVAERLGWQLWDQRLTDEIARRMECDRRHVEQTEERKDPLHYRLFKAFLRGSYEGSLNAPRLHLADAEGIRQTTAKLIKEVAAEGNAVIVGRGSAYYLCERTDAFHVFIYAPFGEKVRRLQSEGKSESEATELVQNVDQDRTAFIKANFGLDWPARQYFHLMVNSTLGDEAAAEMIFHAITSIKGGAICREPT